MLSSNANRAVMGILLGTAMAHMAFAAPLILDWSVTYTGLGLAEGTGVAVDADGVYATGRTWPSGGDDDMFVVRRGFDGSPVWDRQWGDYGYFDRGWRLTLTASHVYVAGDSQWSSNHGAHTFKYTKSGTLDTSNSSQGWWTRYVGSSGYNYATSVAVDASGNMYKGGEYEKYFYGFWSYVRKYDSSGVLQWHREYGNPGDGIQWRSGRMTMSGDNLYSAARSNASGENQVVVAKCHSDGTAGWQTQWGSTSRDEMGRDIAASGSDLYVTGSAGGDVLLLKLHDDGTSVSVLGSTLFAGAGDESGYAVEVANGKIYIAGSTLVAGNRDALLLVYDTDLNLLQNLTWGGAGDDTANDVTVYDGKVYVTGMVNNQAFINAYGGVDCNGNGLPDPCDLDCSALGGACELPNCGLSEDCNTNGTPDECEPDCQPNGVPDDCDLINQTSQDVNGNGVPDECEGGCINDDDCEDADVCTANECNAGTCLFTTKRYGDIDGNGFITLADLFCVLDGFSGDFTNCTFGQDDIHGTGNPIACVPPAVAPCCPNGVITLGDLFAVLDAFGGEDACCTP